MGIAPSNLRAAAPQEPGTLRVVVTAEDSGEPLAGAVVSIPELGITTATDQTGAAVIPNMRPGSYAVLVSSLGYSPVESQVELGDNAALEIALSSTPIPLEPVLVEGQADFFDPALERTGFYERRSEGLGYFFDRADIERANPRIPSDLVRFLPGVDRTQLGSSTYAINSRRGFAGFAPVAVIRGQEIAARCRMPIFVNGSPYGDAGILDDFPLESIAALEVYSSTSSVPVEYATTSTNCGLILAWTVGFNVDSPVAGRPLGVFEEVVRPGDDVRIASEPASGRFRVTVAGPTGLILRSDAAPEPIVVPGSAMTSLEVSLGPSVSLERSVMLGSVAGALGGAILLATCHTEDPEDLRCARGAPLARAAVSVGLGAVLGLVASWVSDEEWAVGRLPIERSGQN